MGARVTSLSLWLLVALCGCALRTPDAPAGPCGGAGQRCCPLEERADAGASANGCRAGQVCGVNRAPTARGTAPYYACQSCPEGQVACGDDCFAPSSPSNPCRATGCPTGQSACDGVGCVNLQGDPANCGACRNACPSGQACTAGRCVGACSQPGETLCPGSGCVNPSSDAMNCGSCGNACSGGQVCTSRICRCATGLSSCGVGRSATCVDRQSDSANCGACGRSCEGAIANAAAVCASGSCVVAGCRPGFGDCTSSAGCETGLNSDVNHCGACGNRCRFANASASCVSGACTMGACSAGFTDCNSNPVDGCETNLASDVANCGACGTRCTAAPGLSVSCRSRSCFTGVMCAAGLGDCTAAPGCETSTNTDAQNCGRCGGACNGTNGTAGCSGGTCVSIACRVGFGNCDASLANGCESELLTDANNCGRCGTRCVYAHAAAACPSGSCVMGACAAGYGNCDGSTVNGCETDTAASNAHCGACGRACPTGMRCASGACVATCPTGTTECATLGVGCVTTSTAVEHCGGCGAACNVRRVSNGAAFVCMSGACRATACVPGFTPNGDGSACVACGAAGQPECVGASARCASGATPCATGSASTCFDLSNNPAHCGGCSSSCATLPNATGVCAAGVCACATGFFDCDGNRANGCESSTACT